MFVITEPPKDVLPIEDCRSLEMPTDEFCRILSTEELSLLLPDGLGLIASFVILCILDREVFLGTIVLRGTGSGQCLCLYLSAMSFSSFLMNL